MSLTFGFDEVLAHRIEAGADLFLMPSLYEPAGLNQLYSMRYGTPPVVRGTGGGNVLSQGVHNLDLLYYLASSGEPEKR